MNCWENACSTHIDPIIKLQKRAVRTMIYAVWTLSRPYKHNVFGNEAS